MSIAPTLKNTSLSFSFRGAQRWTTLIAQRAFEIVRTADVYFYCEVEEATRLRKECYFKSTNITDPDLPIPGGLLKISVDGDPEEILDIKTKLLESLSYIGACQPITSDLVFQMPDNTNFAFSILDGTEEWNTIIAKRAFQALATKKSRAQLVCMVQMDQETDTDDTDTDTDDPGSHEHGSTAENEVTHENSKSVLITDPNAPIPPGKLSVAFDGEPSAISAIENKMMAFLAEIPVARQSIAGRIVFAMRRQTAKKENNLNRLFI